MYHRAVKAPFVLLPKSFCLKLVIFLVSQCDKHKNCDRDYIKDRKEKGKMLGLNILLIH